ncbi:MAG: serine/threonine protein kinase [Acidiferrobacterales bacterium]|nr:serine/threonine protein kinase [Acidiferrobacterales bacterium]
MGIFTKKPAKEPEEQAPAETNSEQTRRYPIKSGESIENYLVEGVIGGGGFSIVYRAFDATLGESVVLKEYFPNLLAIRGSGNDIKPITPKKKSAFDVGMQQFFAEAHALSKVSHPNVINIINVFRSNNTAYMVSKLQPGKDLRWMIKRCQGDLDQGFIQKVMPPVISGVDSLHRAGILHLDIKPANILLRTVGGPLLLDFGASKTMSRQERFSSFQTLTPGFAPPEQHHKAELGPGSDIYAIGATIYACVTGRPPPTSLKREQKERELKLKGAEKNVSNSVIEALKWALELEMNKRPQNVREFANLLMQDSEWGSYDLFQEDLMRNFGR